MQARPSRIDEWRQRVRSILQEDLPAFLCGQFLVGVFAVLILRMWRWRPGVPSSYIGDALQAMATIKNVSITGWYTSSEFLGAPYGQDLHDYPAVGDFLHLLIVRSLTMVTDSPALILNLFYLASFFSVFTGAYIASRLLGLSRTSTVAVSLLYTFLPYHMTPGAAHLFLASYGAVPLWTALVVRQMGDRPLVARPPPLHPRGWIAWYREPSHLGAVVVVLLGATTGLYYAVFMMLAVTVAVVVGQLVHRQQARTMATLFLGGIGATILAVQFVPTVLFHSQYGSNAEILNRGLRNIEFYSLKLSDLLLPIQGHRLPFLANLSEKATEVVLLGEQNVALGLVGAAGLVAMLIGAARLLMLGRPGGRAGALAVLTGWMLLVASVGGVATIGGVFGFTYLRAWSRSVVVIGFCALVVVGFGLDWLGNRRGKRVKVLAAALVTIFGLLDVSPAELQQGPDQVAEAWASDQEFVQGAERILGPGSAVFQLPIVEFPESPPDHKMSDYDHLRGYLHSDVLHWSYGGVKGRSADWQKRLVGLDLDEQAIAVAEAGFEALWVDLDGFPEGTVAQPEVLDAPVLESADGSLILFDLRPLARSRLAELGGTEVNRRAAQLLEPVTWNLGSGFSGLERDGERVFAWAEKQAELRIQNPTGATRDVLVEFLAASGVDGSWWLRVGFAKEERTFDLDAAGTVVEIPLTVPPGVSVLRLSTDAPLLEATDPRDLNFRIFSPQVATAAS